MSNPIAKYIVTAGQTEFDVPFPYLLRPHVQVSVNGEPTLQFSWINDGRIKLNPGPVAGASVVVQRNTPIIVPAVEFQDGAVLTELDLNTAVAQLLFRHQELTALYNGALQDALVRIASNLGVVTNPEDVAQELAELVLEDEVLNNFRDKIAEIEANSALLGTQGSQIAAHAGQITSQSALIDTINGLTAGLRADLDTLSGVVDGLAEIGDGEGISALIASEAATRADADLAQAAVIALVGAKNEANNAFILNLGTVKVSPTETLGDRLTSINSTAADNAAAILTEQSTRATAIAAEATSRNNLATTLRSETASAVGTEATARANGDAAEASARTSIVATLRAETAASVSSEASARVAADGVHTANFTLLGARNGAGTGWILNSSTVLVSPTVSLGTRLSGIDASIGTVSASVVTEQNARASADSALSSSITTLSTTVGGHTASISTLSSSVSGLSAKYGVSLDVNGYVTGFVQNNNGSSGSFVILADKFAIVDPGGGSPYVPFEITGGVTYIKSAVIKNLAIDLPKLDRSGMTAYCFDSTTGTCDASSASSGGHVDYLSATMDIGPGGTIYCAYSGRSTSTGTADTTQWNSIEVTDNTTGAVIASLKLPWNAANQDLNEHLMRFPHLGTSARTVRVRIRTRKGVSQYSSVFNPAVSANWTCL